MKKRITYLLMCMACAVLIVLGCSAEVQAATTFKKLKNNKKYEYDITGDGKAETIKVKTTSYAQESDGNGHCRIYVNGKKKLDESGKAFGQAWYYRTSKSNEYIIAQQFFMGGASEYVVYQSKNGKVKRIGELPSGYYSGSLKSTDDGLSYTTSEKYRYNGAYLGELDIKMKVKIASGKIKLTSATRSVGGTVKYKATKTFSLMTKPGGKTKASVKVAVGATFKINKAYAKKVKYASGYVGYDYYYRVTYKGVTGWIPEDAEFTNLDY